MCSLIWNGSRISMVKEIRVDLTEPGALYDYLVEYAAPEGVQEDEL